MCICTVCISSAPESQKRVFDPHKLLLWASIRVLGIGPWSSARVILTILPAEPSLGTQFIFLNCGSLYLVQTITTCMLAFSPILHCCSFPRMPGILSGTHIFSSSEVSQEYVSMWTWTHTLQKQLSFKTQGYIKMTLDGHRQWSVSGSICLVCLPPRLWRCCAAPCAPLPLFSYHQREVSKLKDASGPSQPPNSTSYNSDSNTWAKYSRLIPPCLCKRNTQNCRPQVFTLLGWWRQCSATQWEVSPDDSVVNHMGRIFFF